MGERQHLMEGVRWFPIDGREAAEGAEKIMAGGKKAKKRPSPGKKAGRKKGGPRKARVKSAPALRRRTTPSHTRPPRFVEGLPAKSTIRAVPLGEIDVADKRFQFRLSPTTTDLRASIRANGQQVPVVLWGADPPYRIVDGFRRVTAIEEIGWDSVQAIVRNDLSEQDAFALSFIENVRRKNYSPMDKANAVWQAIHARGMSKEEIAGGLGLSVRQVDRYLELLELGPALREAVRTGKISMAHAAALHQSRADKLAEWIRRTREEGLTAKQLRRHLKKAGKVGRPKLYLRVDDRGGFRMYPFRYRPDTEAAERKRIIDALEKALKLVKRG